jgi:hypothetical protein
MPKGTTPKVWVREVFANGDERCEVRWPAGAEGVDYPVDDWRHVRDVDLSIDPVAALLLGEAVAIRPPSAGKVHSAELFMLPCGDASRSFPCEPQPRHACGARLPSTLGQCPP